MNNRINHRRKGEENSYAIQVQSNLVAEAFDDKWQEAMFILDKDGVCPEYNKVLDELENIAKNVLINDGISPLFKKYVQNLNYAAHLFKEYIPEYIRLNGMTSSNLIILSGMVDEIRGKEKRIRR